MAKDAKSQQPDARTTVVDALMALATEQAWDDISLNEIAEKAGMSLADLRDLYPSKGAMLAGFIRRIDRIVLDGTPVDLADEPARERVMDVMLRRFDALLPYREALRAIHKAFKADVLGLAALNQQALNSWRYMLAAIGIETEGAMGYLRLQGAILVFARAFETFLDEADETLPRTMAVLDKELKRGEWLLARAEGVNRFMAPLRGFCRAAHHSRRSSRSQRENHAL